MKRGDVLANNFLEILLAVIGLIAVGYFAYQIYQVSVNQETTIAKRMLDSLETKINRLEVGQTGEFTMKTPCKDKDLEECNWFLVAWGKGDLTRPEKCYFKSCVCACRRVNGGGWEDHLRVNVCQTNGFCRFFADDSIRIIGQDEKKDIMPVGTDPIPLQINTGILEKVSYIRPRPLSVFNVTKEASGLTIQAV